MSIIKKITNRFYKIIYQYSAHIDHEILNHENHFFYLIKMTEEDVEKMHKVFPEEFSLYKRNVLLNRFKQSNIISFIVKEEDNICGYFHIDTKEIYDSLINFRQTLPEKYVYLFDDYTFIKHRGKGVHAFSIAERLKFCKTMGFEFAKTHIMAGNLFSEKAYLKNDFFKTTKIVWYNLIFKKVHFIRNIKN